MNKIIVLLASSLLLASLFTVYVTAQTPSSTFWITSGIYSGAPDFTIWVESGEYFAKNENGVLSYAGTDADVLINSVLAVGGHILIKAGDYPTDADLDVTVDGTYLEGEHGTRILCGAQNFGLLVATGTDRVTIKRIHVNGTGINGVNGFGICYDYNCTNGLVTECYVTHTGLDGIHLRQNYNSTVAFNTIESTGDDCIASLLGGYNTIIGNHVDHTGTETTSNSIRGITVGAENGTTVQANTVINTLGDGILIQAFTGISINVAVTGNTVSRAGQYATAGHSGNGIHVQYCTGITITGNTVYECGWNGIRVYWSNYTVISSNVVRDNGQNTSATFKYGIDLEYYSMYNTVTGCTVFDTGGNTQDYGIVETGGGTNDYNCIVGCTSIGHPQLNITLDPASNSEVLGCWNGTEWIGGTTGATGPAGPAGGLEGQQSYDYLVFVNSTDTYMVNGTTGAIDFAGDSNDVINNALGNASFVWLASGTYELDDDTGISITDNGRTLRGMDYGTVITCDAGFDDHVIHVEADYVTISNLRIDGTNQASSYHGIVEDGNGNGGIFIHHVTIEDCGSDGIRLGDTDGSWEGNWGKIHHVVIRNNGQYGIYMTYDSTDSEIMDILISGHDGANDAGIRVEGDNIRIATGHLWGNEYEMIIAEANNVRGLIVSNLGIMDGGSQGQHRVYHASGFDFYGSAFVNCEFWVAKLALVNTYDGLSLTGDTHAISITGCVFRGDNEAGTAQGRYGIDLDASCHNMTITANVFHGFAQSDPIETTGASDITESANIVWDC